MNPGGPLHCAPGLFGALQPHPESQMEESWGVEGVQPLFLARVVTIHTKYDIYVQVSFNIILNL